MRGPVAWRPPAADGGGVSPAPLGEPRGLPPPLGLAPLARGLRLPPPPRGLPFALAGRPLPPPGLTPFRWRGLTEAASAVSASDTAVARPLGGGALDPPTWDPPTWDPIAEPMPCRCGEYACAEAQPCAEPRAAPHAVAACTAGGRGGML